MSRLILTGDTNENFGRYVPAPYVDQIYIGVDSDDTGEVDVDINVYIRVDENTDETALISQIQDFRFYWHVVSTLSTQNSDTWKTELSTNGIDGLINGEYSVWSLCNGGATTDRTNDFTGWPGSTAGNFFKISELVDGEGAIEYEVIFDEAGNRVLKFAYSSYDHSETVTLKELHSAKEEFSSSDTHDLYVLAWCYPGGPGGEYSSVSPADEFDDRWGNLIDLRTSNVAYDLFWSGGQPATTEEITWVDENEEVYDGTPIQSISSKYYSVDVLTHADIVAVFQGFLDTYEEEAKTDESLQEMIDQISYILETYGGSAEILPQLNLLRRVFPSKSSATAVGRFYIEFRDGIYLINTTAESGTEVFKKIVLNTKVIDNRSVSIEWTAPDTTEYGIIAPTYPLTDAYYYAQADAPNMVANMKLARTSFYDTNGDGVSDYDNNYGFFFFDYDKALYETLAIAAWFDLETIINILGKEFLNNYFRLSSAKFLRKNKDDDTWVTYRAIEANFNDNDDEATGYKINTVTHTITTDDGAVPYVNNGDDCFAYSFVLLRNFQLAQEAGNSDYRIMCFEVQDLAEATNPYSGGRGLDSENEEDNDPQGFVTIHDTSLSLISEFGEAYNEAITGLAEYVTTATGECQFSELDNRWLESFVIEMHALYDDDMGNAPWVFYPTYYAVHKELLTKELGGDLTAVMAEAGKISAKINPDYGTKTELESFQEDFKTLYSTFYGEAASDLMAAADSGTLIKYFYQLWTDDELTADATYDYSTDESVCDTTAYATEPPSGIGASDYAVDIVLVSPDVIRPAADETDVGVQLYGSGYTYWGYVEYDIRGTQWGDLISIDGVEMDNAGETDIEFGSEYLSIEDNNGNKVGNGYLRFEPDNAYGSTSETTFRIVLEDALDYSTEHTIKLQWDLAATVVAGDSNADDDGGYGDTGAGGVLANYEWRFTTENE